MTSEYTPTTEQVREFWASDGQHQPAAKSFGAQESADEFDRWLAAHDAEVAAKAKAEVVEAMEQSNLFDFKPVWGSNERDQEILRFGEHLMDIARAAALRASTGGENRG